MGLGSFGNSQFAHGLLGNREKFARFGFRRLVCEREGAAAPVSREGRVISSEAIVLIPSYITHKWGYADVVVSTGEERCD
jgi:hypothetical protein